jgi:hypothetical protein
LGIEYDVESQQWITIESRIVLEGLDRPDACLYPGFVGTDYKPAEEERCLVMSGTAWQSSPCRRDSAVAAICEYGEQNLVHSSSLLALLN